MIEAQCWLEIRSQQRRAEAEWRQRLAAALYHHRPAEAARACRRLRRLLGRAADHDPDLELAHHWLEEQEELAEKHRKEVRRSSLKLLLTAAPLVLATFLTGLLGIVLMSS